MTPFEWIFAASIIMGVIERIIAIRKARAKTKEAKKRIEKVEGLFSDAKEVLGVVVEGIEKLPINIGKPAKEMVKLVSIDKKIRQKVDSQVQDIVGNK